MDRQNMLEEIIKRKRREIKAQIKARKGLFIPFSRTPCGKSTFMKSLATPGLSVIAEIKRRSPSMGLMAEIPDPGALALRYCEGGAAAISVLTDEEGFGGTSADLIHVVKTLKEKGIDIPVLRKDFIIDPFQIEESAAMGADAILLIAGVLRQDLAGMIARGESLGLEMLVEVDDDESLEIALEANAKIIGVNNRNLKDFTVASQNSLSLYDKIPRHIIKVAESGIKTREDALEMFAKGYDAILVGEALVKAKRPEHLIKEMKGQ